MGVVVEHKLVSSGLNVRKRMYNHVLQGIILLMFNKTGLCSYKVLMYKSLFLTKLSNAPPPGKPFARKRPMVGTYQMPVQCPGDGLRIGKVKSAYEPSGSSGRSLSQSQEHEATRSISTPPWMGC